MVAEETSERETEEAVATRDEREDIRAFKHDQFVRLGFGDLAEVMVDQGVDWHYAEELLNRGWSRYWILKVLY